MVKKARGGVHHGGVPLNALGAVPVLAAGRIVVYEVGAKSSSSAKSGSPFLGGRASGPAEPVLPNVDRVGRNLPSAVASVVVDVYKVYTPRGLYRTQKEVSGS